MSTKKENTRIVTFNKDYKPGNRVLYKKGEQHAIHKDTVDKIKENKGDFEALTYDEYVKSKSKSKSSK